MPPLPELIKELYRSARRRPGTTISLKLSKGARLAVVYTETEVAFTMGRPQRRVGDREEQTFKLAARVPPGARRIPKEGQAQRQHAGRTFYIIGYVWERQP
jgi:hypothetical protein